MSDPYAKATGTKIYNTHGDRDHPEIWTVPENVHTISLYGCGGGDGGRSGTISYGYEVPGPGGRGGNGSIPHFAVEAGSIAIPVNPGDIFSILVGNGGTSDQPGSSTVVTQLFAATQAPLKQYFFDQRHGPTTLGGDGASSSHVSSRRGANTSDPRDPTRTIQGGAGARYRNGNHDDHCGGGGGGGGAGMAPGGDGGSGGCDGGTQIGYPGGSHDPNFRVEHSGKRGQDGQGNGAGGGGGGGPGDGADDHIFDPGGSGGTGGDGYLEIRW